MSGIEVVVENEGIPPQCTNGVYKLYTSESGMIEPRRVMKIPTGFRMRIPRTHFGKVQQSTIKTLGGVVDSDYRGEICVIAYNDSDKVLKYERGCEVGEMVICEIVTPTIEVIE